ncbi:MAG: trigger factor [Rikenellaceae bacterium]|nr:trigger factor [Rikenellaceae bacterium]MDY3893055.1 trigger factor [Candidatus Cryptobacteroides sp.]
MKLTKNNIDELNIEVALTVEPSDYAENRKKKLSDIRRRAEIKGFRKGMVPASLIEKMYGASALVDSVNEVISHELTSFIKDEKLSVIGEPLPADNQPENDWTNGNTFNFTFEIACNPEVKLEFGKEDKITSYEIKVSDEAKKEMKDNLLKQYGSLEDGDEAKADDFIIADLEQGENRIESTYIALRNVSEACKSQFVGVKAGDSFEVNVNEAFENEADRAALIKVKKEELEGIDPVYKLTVKTVKTFTSAPLTTETYDKIFGEGVVADEAGFDAKIEERLVAEYANETEYRLSRDIREYLVKKADLKLPETFMKKWLKVANEGKFTAEQIDKEFDAFAEDYRWSLVRDFLLKKYGVKIEQEDILASARGFAAYQFAMYGMPNVPAEQLDNYAKSILADENQSRRIVEQVESEKAIAAVKPELKINKKSVSVEQFRELK